MTAPPPRLVAVASGPPLKQRVRVGPAEVAYVEGGDPSAPPVVLLHGFPTHSYLWRHVIAELDGQARLLAPDLPGLGDTDVSPYEDFGAPAQAELLLGFLDRLGLDRVALVGHDVGGAVAQQVVANHPQRCSHLALVSSVTHDRWTTASWVPLLGLHRPGRAAVARALELPRPVDAVRAGLLATVHDRAALPAPVLDELLRPLTTVDGWERARRALAAADPDATSECTPGLRRFEGPALVVWGADDPVLSPSWAVRLADELPTCGPPALLPFCGHLVPEERPVELARLLGRWLAGSA